VVGKETRDKEKRAKLNERKMHPTGEVHNNDEAWNMKRTSVFEFQVGGIMKIWTTGYIETRRLLGFVVIRRVKKVDENERVQVPDTRI
jgi:predicted ribonuclease toxin of YeeF-YezG toxin-antitoxin module